MADTEFSVITVSDDKIVTSFRRISEALGVGDRAKLNLIIQSGGNNPKIECQLSQIADNEFVAKIIATASTIVRTAILDMQVSSGTVKISLHRHDGFDRFKVSTPDSAQFSELLSIHVAVREIFKEYDRTGLIDRELSPALAEFYERREASLLRLEELSDRLIRQNEEYRRRVDAQFDQDRSRLDEVHKQRQSELEAEHAATLEALAKRAEDLDKRESELDDRSNTHARRQLQRELKNVPKDRSHQFSLTKGTARKR